MKFDNGQFWHGDCLELMKDIPDGSVDMILTDIPYNEVNRKSMGLRNLNKGIADSAVFNLHTLLSESVRTCKGSVYIFCGFDQISEITRFMREHGSIRLGFWHKTNPSPMNGDKLWLSGVEACVYMKKSKATFNEHCTSPVWSNRSDRSKIHPTQKPVELFKRLIEASTNISDVVLDPFAGSGTTAVACERLNRKWICIEKDQTYYREACCRVAAEYY